MGFAHSIRPMPLRRPFPGRFAPGTPFMQGRPRPRPYGPCGPTPGFVGARFRRWRKRGRMGFAHSIRPPLIGGNSPIASLRGPHLCKSVAGFAHTARTTIDPPGARPSRPPNQRPGHLRPRCGRKVWADRLADGRRPSRAGASAGSSRSAILPGGRAPRPMPGVLRRDLGEAGRALPSACVPALRGRSVPCPGS